MTAGADTTPTRGRRTIAWACAALGAGVAVGACWAYFTSADGFVTNPDYWGLRHLGERVELRDPATWRNGFYPWLTVLLYGAYAAFDIGVRGATAVATVAMGVACLAVGSLGARRGRVTATLFGALSLLALPGWITNAATPTTDTSTSRKRSVFSPSAQHQTPPQTRQRHRRAERARRDRRCAHRHRGAHP